LDFFIIGISHALAQLFRRLSQTPARALHQIPTQSNRLARKNHSLRTPKRTAHHPTQSAERSDAERLMKKMEYYYFYFFIFADRKQSNSIF